MYGYVPKCPETSTFAVFTASTATAAIAAKTRPKHGHNGRARNRGWPPSFPEGKTRARTSGRQAGRVTAAGRDGGADPRREGVALGH